MQNASECGGWTAFPLAAGLLGFALLALLPAVPARSQTFADSGFAAETLFSLPNFQAVGLTWASDGKMFIWQKNGVVRIYENGVLLPTPFIDLSGQVNTFADRGMLGLAVDPDFASNRYVYLAYVYEGGGDPNDEGPKISRFTRVTANPANPAVALAGSEVILIDDIPVDSGGHSLGTVRFAADGTLFLSNGDGASAAFVDARALGALNIDSLRGKILRVNPDGSAPAPPQVTNPFYDGTNSIRSKVYAFGFRNPYRFAIHPTLGEIYAGDVGWTEFEEIDRVVRGANHGWPCYEGIDPQPVYQSNYPATCGPLEPGDVVPPMYSYAHPSTSSGAVVGGAFYTGGVYPSAYANNLFFADYTQGWMRRLVLNPDGSLSQNLLFATDLGAPVSVELGPDGLLYYADFISGAVRRIVRDGPIAVASASPQWGYSPLQVSFSSAGSTGGPLTYSWNFGDGTTSTAANPTHTYTTGAVQTYVAQLTVRNAADVGSTAQVAVTVGSLPPDPTILEPDDGVGVLPGQIVSFQGNATDPDQTLGAAALHWDVLLHHNDHIHSFVGGTGFSGSFASEYHGTGNYSYELILTATDSSGLEASASVQIPVLPDTSAPSNPTNLVATAAGSNAINLSWSAATDNAAVSSYRIERCSGVLCSNFAEIGTATGTSFASSGLAPETIYRFRVRASDPTGNLSGYSNAAGARTSAGGPPPTPRLIAAYGFEEGAGSTLGDLSGTGNHGSVAGATWTSAGRYGKALAFDGANDVVVIPDSNSLDLTSAATFEAWVYPTVPVSGWKAILQKEVDAYFLMASTDANRPGIGGTFAGVCCATLDGPSGLPANQWSHVAGTYDGAFMRLYVNGAEVASQVRTGSIQVNGFPLRLGGNTYSGEFFPGRLDDVRIYDRALSLSEIQTDMNTALPEPGSSPALIAGICALGWLRRRLRSRTGANAGVDSLSRC